MGDSKIGFHARSMEEFKRLVVLPEVSVLELKPEKFTQGLYHYLGSFIPNRPILNEISTMAEENHVDLQVHMPPDLWGKDIELMYVHSNKSDFPFLLDRFSAYLEIYDQYKIGSTITMHPPVFKKDSRQYCNIWYAMDKGNIIYKKYDKMISESGLDVKIGLENMVLPRKKGTMYVGYESHHFKNLLTGTDFGLTLDLGHMNLNPEMEVDSFVNQGNVNNIHLHGNLEVPSNYDYSDDIHRMANPIDHTDFYKTLDIAKKSGVSVICEISKLNKYADEELRLYLSQINSYLNT